VGWFAHLRIVLPHTLMEHYYKMVIQTHWNIQIGFRSEIKW
jgi:hypothetical protein